MNKSEERLIMRIAFIVGEFPLLSETFILNQITGLFDRGHEVDIFTRIRANQTIVHADVERYNLLDRTFYCGTTERMPANKLLRLVKAIGLVTTHSCRKPMPLVKSLNVLKFGKRAVSLRILYKTIPFLDKGPYDIVHCHFGPNGNLGALLKDVGAIQSKVITTFHGSDISRHMKRKGDCDFLFETGDLFLPISDRIPNSR
jgi:colanic acid/amylovoran biosynthesis glycosyltransferase